MHPELLSSLAAEHRRDLATAVERRARSVRVRKARVATMPRLRVSWTKTRLAAVSGARRGSSVVIVISATRTS